MMDKKNKKEISAMEDLLRSKIYCTPKRVEELTAIAEAAWTADKEPPPPCNILCINLSHELEEELTGELKWEYMFLSHTIREDVKEDRKKLARLFGGDFVERQAVGAVVFELSTDEVTLFDRRVFALAMLKKLPVLALTRQGPGALADAASCSGGTWPVIWVRPDCDLSAAIAFLRCELPRVRALSAAVQADVKARVGYLGEVNATLHFAKRASVALVPFGVMAVNLLGCMRLMAAMLRDSGMKGDGSASKALAVLGAKNAAFVNALDSLGDLYGFVIFSTVLADIQGMALSEALSALDVLDGFMIGSISVVTGAISALCAYLTRPQLVNAGAEFLSALQVMYVLNPELRRLSEQKLKHSKEEKAALKAARKQRDAREAEREAERRAAAKLAGASGAARLMRASARRMAGDDAELLAQLPAAAEDSDDGRASACSAGSQPERSAASSRASGSGEEDGVGYDGGPALSDDDKVALLQQHWAEEHVHGKGCDGALEGGCDQAIMDGEAAELRALTAGLSRAARIGSGRSTKKAAAAAVAAGERKRT